MSASGVLQIVGAVVGFFVTGGSPIGAAVGGAIGGAVGRTLDPNVHLQGPRLNDLRVIASSYGVDLPRIYGAENRVAGTVIWTTGLVETSKRKKSGGKGGGGGTVTKTYSYSTSVALSLSVGECRNIARIWANGKALWSIDGVTAAADALQAKATELETAALAAEAASDAAPGDVFLLAAAVEARARADEAQAAATAAYAAVAAATAGGAPWALEQGAGMPEGPLRYLAFYPGNTTQLPDPEIEADVGAGEAPAYRGVCYIVLAGLQLADFGNSMPNIEVELDGMAPRTVGAILRDLCQASGMAVDEYAVRTQLDSIPVRGYAIATAGSSMAAVVPLQSIYHFDTVEQCGEVRFVPRGLGQISCIPLADVAARQPSDATPDRYTLTRLPDHDLPREVSVTYRDPARDYQDNTQRAVRLFGDAHTVKSEQAAIVLEAGEARRIADRLLWGSWNDRVPASLTVTDKYRFLFAGDVIALEAADTFIPLRVENRVRGADGRIELELRMEDPYVYSNISVGGELEVRTAGASAPTVPNTVPVIGDTFVAVVNTPLLVNGQSASGALWVMDAAGDGWRGGAIYRSTDGSLYSEYETSGERNVTGTVATALGDGPSDIWDRESTLTVVLRYDAHELESLTEAEILEGNNAFWLGAADGSRGEVAQFATATLVSASPKTYILSDLLRGRRATEHETALHGADELIIFFDRDITQDALARAIDYGTADWDRERRYKGVSAYQAEDDVLTYQAFTNLGERAKPRSPVHCTGTRDASNNLTLAWIRRTRLFTAGLGYGTVPLGESTESYEVDVMSGSTVLRTISVSSPTASYTAAEQTADGLTPGNPVAVRIYQISADRGRGHAGVFTV